MADEIRLYPENPQRFLKNTHIEEGDVVAMQLTMSSLHLDCNFTGHPTCMKNVSLQEELYKAWGEWSVMGVAHSGRKGFPIEPTISRSERGINDHEYYHFTQTPVHRWHFHCMLQHLDALLLKMDSKNRWEKEILSRKHLQFYTKTALPQRLGQIFSDPVPEMNSVYSSDTDSVLALIHYPTAHRRQGQQAWSAQNVLR